VAGRVFGPSNQKQLTAEEILGNFYIGASVSRFWLTKLNLTKIIFVSAIALFKV